MMVPLATEEMSEPKQSFPNRLPSQLQLLLLLLLLLLLQLQLPLLLR